MYYEITSVSTQMDNKGNDKKVTEKFIVDNVDLFAECEQKGLELYNGENDIIAIKRSKIMEFINERNEEKEQKIYFATIEKTYVDDAEKEKTMKYLVGLFAETINEATKITLDYIKGGLEDMELVKMQETKFIDII